MVRSELVLFVEAINNEVITQFTGEISRLWLI